MRNPAIRAEKERIVDASGVSKAAWLLRCLPPVPVAMTMAIKAGIQAKRS